MRKRTVKRYNRILAGALTVSLMISSMPANVQAQSVYQERSYAITSEVDDEEADIAENENTGDNSALAQDSTAGENTTQDSAESLDDATEDTEISSETTEISPEDTEVSSEDTEFTEDTTDATTEDEVTTEDKSTTEEDQDSTENASASTENTESSESTDEATTEEDPSDNTGDDSEEVTEADTENTEADTTFSENDAHDEDNQDDDSIAELAAEDLTIDELVSSGIVTYNDTDINVTDMEKGLILLSHCPAGTYADKKITLSGTGNTNLTQKVTYNGKEYEYVPLGDSDYPFSGEITTQLQLNINKTLFGAVTSKAKVTLDSSKQIIWQGVSTSETMYADEYIFAGDEDGSAQVDAQLNIGNIFKINKSSDDTVYNMGNLIGTIKAADDITAGTLEISGFNFVNAGAASNVEMSSSNAGLICNTLSAGTIKLTGGTLPSSYTVASKSSSADTGNAGGLIGEMAAGTGLCIGEGVIWNSPSVTVTSANGSAGGFVGKMGKGTGLTVGENITISNMDVTGFNMAGGIAGVGEDVTIQNENNAVLTFSSLAVEEKKSNGEAYAGGVFGKYTTSTNAEFPGWIKYDQDNGINVYNAGVDLKDAYNHGYIGGLFGGLILNNGSEYTVGGTELKVHRNNGSRGNKNATAFGAIVGIVKTETGAGEKNGALIISGTSDSDLFKVTAYPNKDKKTYYNGGLVGKIDNAYVKVVNVSITAYNPFACSYGNISGFGGVAGCVGDGGVLELSGMVKAATEGDSDKKIWEGGGIVGNALEGSAIVFSGTTDISGETLVPINKVGLLVARQDGALIYAKSDGNGNGWTYIRPDNTNVIDDSNRYGFLDDIGNSGQVIRLNANSSAEGGLSSDLITIDSESHKVKLKQMGALSDTVNIPDADTFALLAIALQSKGVFSAWSDITENTYSNIYSKNINLTGDINLSGTGIYGLTMDDDLDNNWYTGTFNGNSHTITLAIGELYGQKNGSKVTESGNAGEVVRHKHQGIFARVKNATVENLTIKGVINVSAMDHERNTTDCVFNVGGFAGELQGSLTATNVKLLQTMNLTGTQRVNSLNAGGLVGRISEKSTVTLGADGEALVSKVAINIGSNELKKNNNTYSDYLSNYKNIYAGGVIGTVEGDKGTIINCDNVKLGGSITSDDKATLLPAGGLVGYIKYGSEKNLTKVNINDIAVEKQSVTAGAQVTKTGGLLGYEWNDVNVVFAESSKAKGYSLDVSGGSSLSAQKEDANAGGLVYRSNGKWQVNDYGISIADSSFRAKNLGLLVCHMDIDSSQSSNNTKALYLEFTANWETAYNLGEDVIVTDAGVYDEIAAYTAPSADKITDNGSNGIISLETLADSSDADNGVDVAGKLTTYQNRTTYGANKTNGCSRYYYNLYTLGKYNGFGTSGSINTPSRLLAWSIYNYVPGNLKNIMFSNCGLNTSVIGQASGTADLNMDGISYYPINVSGVTVKNANITFYNSEIESLEKSNKSTTGTTNSHSQHYMMHCGLFYNMTASNAAVSTTVEKVSFTGSVGKVNGRSGAISCGVISGDSEHSKIYTLNISELTLDGIRVSDTKDYAPLIINEVSGYTSVTLTDVETSESGYRDEDGKYNVTAASSLIGQFGNKTATQLSIMFSGMILPDMKAGNGIFTRATFLDSYQYADNAIASAAYNFNMSEDWENPEANTEYWKTSKHIKKVTYGKEISDSTQYEGLQLWYYDKATYNSEAGYVISSENGDRDFSGYLPYVYENNAGKNLFEIKVNQRINDLIYGCGTYGHPYEITSALDITTATDYINTGNAKKEWKIAITSAQGVLHASDSSAADLIYRYNGTAWEHVENKSTDASREDWQLADDKLTLSNDVMHTYVCNAYFDIKNDVKLEDFSGIGTIVYPFRGVITSTNTKAPCIELSGKSNGLITYSYGSVISNINVKFTTSSATDTSSALSSSVTGIADDNTTGTVGNIANWDVQNRRYTTAAFWGGIIGCVLGGDNIIDNVSVTTDENWKLNTSGDKAHLIQAGGYVGSVAGGGVIFRNMTGKKGIADGSSLYVNPFVGRVLDGYAFSEDCDIANGDATKICRLDSAKIEDISTTNTDSRYNTNIRSAQGLLVFSAIVNSGGATGASTDAPGTLAYYGAEGSSNTDSLAFGNGQYGKVRNADYKYIGQAGEDAKSDFNKSVSDDTAVPGSNNTPYLVTKYADENTFGVCAKDTKLAISLASDTTYDMTNYGNGYQGISVRYISNAINNGTSNALDNWDFSYAMPKLCGFDGNGTTIKVNMDIKEYADDDFHGVSFGGVFNLIRAAASDECGVEGDRYLVKELTIDRGNIKFTYIGSNGKETTSPDTSEAKRVSVGGFAGNTARNSINDADKASYLVENVKMQNLTVSSPGSAGGFIGSTGMGNDSSSSGAGYLYRVDSSKDKNSDVYNYFGVNLVNCKYSGISVTGGTYAGGFVGFVSSNGKEYGYSTINVKSSLSVTDSAYSVVGQSSSITAQSDGAGGVFGGIASGLYINDTEFAIDNIYNNSDATLLTANFTDVIVTTKGSADESNAGGLIGKSANNDCKIYNVKVNQIQAASDNLITGVKHTGGIIGCIAKSGDGKTTVIDNCEVSNIKVKGGNPGAAGILGGYSDCNFGQNIVSNCTVKYVTVTAKEHCAVGGIIGNVNVGSTAKNIVQNCTVENSSLGDDSIVEWNGGVIGGMANGKTGHVYIYDSIVKDTIVKSSTSNGNAAGLISSANGYVYGNNILLDGVNVSGPADGIASLICAAGQQRTVRIAGLSIKNSNTDKLLATESSFQLGNTSYISFADYTDSAQSDTAEDAHKNLLGIEDEKVVSPYVSTSPKSNLAVNDGDAEKYLHGDGAKWSSSADGKTFTTLAKTIIDESTSTSLTGGKYAYKRIGTDAKAFDFTNNISTYNNNQTVKAGTDFPVLQVAGGTSSVDSTIAQYLDIVTNGGYSNAVKCNPAAKGNNTFTSVSAKTEICVYNKDTGKFTLATNSKSALTVSGDGTSSMKFAASTGYDNDQSRFTLLTVTWNAGNDHTYSIQVPVIVKRIMEIDFMATLGYGTHFRASDYDNLTAHVLDSFDNPMTGYLTYKYNSAKGILVSYGWQDYVNNGGDLTLSIDKTIQFNAVLPVGTQLTLVDCQDADRTAYTYTVSEISIDDNGKAQSNSVAMSAFARDNSASTDGEEAGKIYFKENIGRALGAVVAKDNKGTFIEVDENGKPVGATGDSDYQKPTVNIDGKYYRLMGTEEEKYQRYTVTIDESKTVENYYLVVTMPKTDEITVVNGWLETTVDVQVPHNIHNMLRNAPTVEDGHNDTASTYQISDGYQQVLTDEYSGNTVKVISSTSSTINVEVMDEISFPADQQYKDIDQLYQRFVGSLQNILRSGDDTDSTTTSYKQFPMGTAGTVKFYVYTVDTDGTTKHYYIYGDENGASDTWTDMGASENVALQYPWVSNGGDMELVLSTDGTAENAVSLQKIRKDVIDNKQQKKIYVKAVLNAVLPAASLDVIPVSTMTNGEPGEYAKLSYVAQVSTEKTSLSYSSSKATLAETKVKYYREDQSGAKLTYDAPDIDQLGINLLDPGDNADAEKKTSLINTIARFDLSSIQDLESVLGASTGVQFEMTLKRKNTDSSEVQEDYEDVLLNTSSYMSVQLLTGDSGNVSYSSNAAGSGTWTWTIPKNTYITSSADGKNTLKTSDAFDGSVFTQALDLYVNIDNVEELNHFYSNYKVELSVKVLGSDITGNDNIIYTLTRIKPEFVEQN